MSQSLISGAYLQASKYLWFEQVPMPESRKTGVWNVRSVSSGEHLGGIRWHGPWRQYVFWPKGSTIFNSDCLHTIEDRLETCNRLQKNIRLNLKRYENAAA